MAAKKRLARSPYKRAFTKISQRMETLCLWPNAFALALCAARFPGQPSPAARTYFIEEEF